MTVFKENSLRAKIPMRHAVYDQIDLMGQVMRELFQQHKHDFRQGGVERVAEQPVCLETGFKMSFHFWGYGDDGNDAKWDANHATRYVKVLFHPRGMVWVSITENDRDRNWQLTGDHSECWMDRWDYYVKLEAEKIMDEDLIPADYWETDSAVPFDVKLYPSFGGPKKFIVETERATHHSGLPCQDMSRVVPLEDYKREVEQEAASAS